MTKFMVKKIKVGYKKYREKREKEEKRRHRWRKNTLDLERLDSSEPSIVVEENDMRI